MLKHNEICNLIPHTGDMCLLDTVESWDAKKIVCLSSSHKKENHPLRNSKGLPMLSLMEYGAQAMAVHGCLLADKEGLMMKEGYLAALRDIQITKGWLSDIESELKISAERIYAEKGNMIYTMNVYARSKKLISGRATVISRFINRETIS